MNEDFNVILDTPYLINNDDRLILKMQVEPIRKFTYNFYLIKDKENKYSCIYSRIKFEIIRDILINLKDNQQGLSFLQMLDNLNNNKEYQEFIKTNYSKRIMEFDEKLLSKLLKEIDNLNFEYKWSETQGLDGFHLEFKMNNKYFHSWCYYNENYFSPIIELTNYLLELAEVEEYYRFRMI